MSKKFSISNFIDDQAVDVDVMGGGDEDDEAEMEANGDDDEMESFIDDEEYDEASVMSLRLDISEASGEESGVSSDSGDSTLDAIIPKKRRIVISSSESNEEVEMEQDGDADGNQNVNVIKYPGPSLTEYKRGDGKRVVRNINKNYSQPSTNVIGSSSSSSSSSSDNSSGESSVEEVESDSELPHNQRSRAWLVFESDSNSEDPPTLEPQTNVPRAGTSFDGPNASSPNGDFDGGEAGTSFVGPNASAPNMRIGGGMPELQPIRQSTSHNKKSETEFHLIGKKQLAGTTPMHSFFSCLAMVEICNEKFDGKLQYCKNYTRKANQLTKIAKIHIENLTDDNITINLTKLDQLFKKNIRIWNPESREITNEGELSNENFLNYPEVNLELCSQKHTYSLIPSTTNYCGVFYCKQCGAIFKYKYDKTQHLNKNRCPFNRWQKKNPDSNPDDYFKASTKFGTMHFRSGGHYRPKKTILELLLDSGIMSESEFRSASKKLINPFIAVFDIESLLSRMNFEPRLNTKTTIEYQEKHVCTSISVCSNVPDFQRAQTFIAKRANSNISKEFLTYLYEICDKVESINMEKYRPWIERIIKLKEEAEEKKQKWKANYFGNIHTKLLNNLNQLIVLGWNSSRYDLIVLIRSCGLAYWIDQIEGSPPFVLKKGAKDYLLLKTQRLKFLDLLNFLGTKTSLRSFLRQLRIPEGMGKMFFPYSVLKDHQNLDQTDFPPYEAFFSNLMQSNVLEEDWLLFKQQLKTGMTEEEALKTIGVQERPKSGRKTYKIQKREFKRLKCKYIWQLLAVYNCMDVLPLVECAEKLRKIYFQLTKLDCFQHVTISSLGFPFLIRQIYESNVCDIRYFCFLDEEAFDMVSNSVMGGIAHAFNKIAIAGFTRIEPHRVPPEEREVCKQISSWDANQMYPGSASKFCSNTLGPFAIRRKKNNFQLDSVMNKPTMELVWLKVEEVRRFSGKQIRTVLSPYGQKCIFLSNKVKHPVDGWIWWDGGFVVLEFDGCMTHGCPACYPNKRAKNPLNNKTYDQLYDETMKRNEEIRKHRDVKQLITIWEHDFLDELKYNTNNARDLARFVVDSSPPAVEQNISWQRMSELISEEKIHGFVECSMEVPATPSMYSKFSTFPPFFCRQKIERNELADEEQKKYATTHNLLQNAQPFLLSTMKASNIVIATPLFVQYVQLGLKVTDINRVLQFQRGPVMKEWLEKIVVGRRKAKEMDEPTMTLALKAIANHAYGFGLLNLLDREHVKYVPASKSAKLRRAENFKDCFDVGPEGDRGTYLEFGMRNTSVQQVLPKQLSADILSCSKIPLLSCIYNVFYKYFRRTAWGLQCMDTDSICVMLAGDTMSECCKPEMREEFERIQHHHFVPLDGVMAKQLALEPLLFKWEFRAEIAVSLAPKLYLFLNLSEMQRKMASKGWRRNSENDELTTFAAFFDTLFEGQITPMNDPIKAVVRGMKTKKDGQLYTFMQMKRGLTKLSPKFGYCQHEIHYFPRELLTPENEQLLKEVFPYHCCDNALEIWESVVDMVEGLSPLAKHYVFGDQQ